MIRPCLDIEFFSTLAMRVWPITGLVKFWGRLVRVEGVKGRLVEYEGKWKV